VNDQERSELAPEPSVKRKRDWTAPSLEVIAVTESEGSVGGSPVDDGLSGHS